MSLAFIFNCDQMALYCSENKVFDSFLEQVFVLFFLDVCRESVLGVHFIFLSPKGFLLKVVNFF